MEPNSKAYCKSKLMWFNIICRFNGKDFLERVRGKSIMFVGDSLSQNQWQSLTCLLHSSLPHASFNVSRLNDVSTFEFLVCPQILVLYYYYYFVFPLLTSNHNVFFLVSLSAHHFYLLLDLG